ncbi:phosphotransferase family protein [Cryptosporangium aurantiacum]|uniref:Predicted kinase, aminoglycoside phosphotransferase (APT) family n=1 Tax=Cryptosporangium aurantiacum TaxID=134849 RepID=A0A1M7PLK3_9ACTN|nr:phosphotransferase family protein [Cryptosporangium aurantiacum]SHN18153.1 Predicted kinase, aminoglycoside phosphotransferase (APT) family [Cryptosporangium aurantiacum]
MTVATRRDVESTRTRLTSWLAEKLRAADVAVSELVIPEAGYSNETAFCEVSWTDWKGRRVQRSLVLRIEPTGHQLFARPDAVFQARMMTTLARATTVSVPEVLFVETDADVFGAPFYVMERVAGRIPPDVPSWHRKGWVTGLDAAQRARMYDNGLRALAQLHAVDAHRYFGFLEPADGQPSFDAYLDGLRAWHSWAEPDVRYDADVVKAAVAYVDAARPYRPEEVVVWRDARPGNIIFADDLSVAALLDWETSTLGPPGVDLGWWVVFEEYLCEAQGLSRLEGVPGREATIARYQELTGREIPDVGYYEVLAALELSLITSRLTRLLIEDGLAERIAVEYTTRVTGMLAGKLARVGA